MDELYQQYLADPDSVDPAWHGFFEDYRPGDGTGGPSAIPTPPATLAPSTSNLLPLRHRPATPPRHRSAAPAVPPTAPTTVAEDVDTQVLRGPAARVVTNMEASLAVPTATSVRAIPAKLLIDNRTVINNHLRRSRGGKVSFTHLIAWAVVQALKGDAGDERQLRRARRQAGRSHAPTGSTSASPSTSPSPTAPASCWCRRSRPPRRWTSPASGRPTKTSIRRARAGKLARRRLRRAPRSA